MAIEERQSACPGYAVEHPYELRCRICREAGDWCRSHKPEGLYRRPSCATCTRGRHFEHGRAFEGGWCRLPYCVGRASRYSSLAVRSVVARCDTVEGNGKSGNPRRPPLTFIGKNRQLELAEPDLREEGRVVFCRPPLTTFSKLVKDQSGCCRVLLGGRR